MDEMRSDKPKSRITIVIPIYNMDRYLPECMDSILCQTFSDFEVICIDDGSTDRSGEILDQYAAVDPRIQVIHKKNTGYGHSMNVGIDQAQGKYLAIVESDDIAEQTMLEVLFEAAEKNNLDVVKGEFSFLYQNGENSPHRYGQDVVYGEKLRPKENYSIFRELLMLPGIWSGLYRMDFLQKHRIRFHETPGASFQDISFVFQLLLKTERFLLLDTPIYQYRSENVTSSVKSVEKPFCIFDEFAHVKSWCTGSAEEEIYKKITPVKYEQYFANYYRVDALYQYAALEKIKDELALDGGRKLLDNKDLEWKDTTKKCVSEVLDDPDEFYRKSCSAYWDRIGYRGKTLNSVQMLFDLLHYYDSQRRPIYVYGAGVYGCAFLRRAEREEIEICAILVSERRSEQNELSGKPIIQSTYINNYDEAVVVVAMKKTSQKPVLDFLKQRNCTHVISLGISEVEEELQ